MRKKAAIILAMACVMAAVNFASADNIRGINMDFVTIGNAGNPGDTRTGRDSRGWPMPAPYGGGAVGYNYNIGKYEVSNAQWNAFVAAAGVPTGTDGGYGYSATWTAAQQPTNSISWYEVAQFCNYLTSGNKSKGAYQFSGNNASPGTFLGINRNAAISSYGIVYVIPTEDEWYKAAYFKPDGSGYSVYANGLDTIPAADNGWNYDGGGTYPPWNVNTGTREQNGTFNMMGNIWEWTETTFGSSSRVQRGGAYSGPDFALASSYTSGQYANVGYLSDAGFRIASIPEPATLLLLGLGAARFIRRR